MKKNWMVVLISIVLWSCGAKEGKEAQQNGITIRGRVGFPQTTGQIIIRELRPGVEKPFQDTIKLKSDFTFQKFIALTEPGYYQLNFYDRQFVNLILDKSDIEVNVDGNNEGGFSEVKGSRDLDLIQGFQKTMQEAQQSPELTAIEAGFQEAVKANDEKKIEALREKYMEALAATQSAIAAKISAEPASLGIADFLLNGRVIDQDKHFDVYVTTADKLRNAWPNNYFANQFVSYVDKAKKTAIGQPAPEISLPDPDGKVISLSSLKGKYILVDFWAKWCGPCRRENPNVVKAYQAFKGKGFDILGVSLDRTREDWMRAIEEDGLVWNHVSDLRYFESQAALDYNINAIPFSILVDPQGIIVAKNLRGPELHRKLAEVLH